MTDIRIWHHGLDQYHAAFRVIRLMSFYQTFFSGVKIYMPVSKLKILDMFLAYPSLLHRLSYSREGRASLNNLNIPKPEKEFVNLPSNPALFRSMEMAQKAALSDLAAKGIIDKEKFLVDQAFLVQGKVDQNLLNVINDTNDNQKNLLSFLMTTLGSMELNGPDNIFRVTKVHRSFT